MLRSAPWRRGSGGAWQRRGGAGRGGARPWVIGHAGSSARSGTLGTVRPAQDPTEPGTFRSGYGGRSGHPTPARRLRLRRFPWPGPPSAAVLRGPRGNRRPSVAREPRRACRGRSWPAAELVCARVEQVRRGGGWWVPASLARVSALGSLPPRRPVAGPAPQSPSRDASVPGLAQAVSWLRGFLGGCPCPCGCCGCSPVVASIRWPFVLTSLGEGGLGAPV